MNDTFVIAQQYLVKILSFMQPICSKRSPLQSTGYIYIQINHKEAILKSTDLEISLQASCRLESNDTQMSLSFLVSGKRFYDLIKELEGDICFRLKKGAVVLQSNAIDLSLKIRDVNDFPQFPERIENLMDVESDFLQLLLNKVLFIIPQNNANNALNGLYIELSDKNITMTATNGYCLARVETKRLSLSKLYTWLVPRRAILGIKKILEHSQDKTVFLGLCDNQLVISGESFNFFTRLLPDQFPEYSTILKKESFKSATIDRSMFIKTLRRASCLLSGQFIAAKLDFFPTKLDFSMKNEEIGSLNEKLSIDNFSGNDISLCFYSPYLLSGLQVFSEELVSFSLKDSVSPIIFESCDAQNKVAFTYLVMPVSPTKQ